IAGGGGGLNASTSLPENMIYPSSLKPALEAHHYVFDIRLPGGHTTAQGFVRSITQAEADQKDTFIDLCKSTSPSFGFHCFRMTTEGQYLARYEIDQAMEAIRSAKASGVEYGPQS